MAALVGRTTEDGVKRRTSCDRDRRYDGGYLRRASVKRLDGRSRELVGDLPSGPDPELLDLHPSGSPVYIANEDDNLLTVIDLADKKVVAEVEVGVEPEGVGVSPAGKP